MLFSFKDKGSETEKEYTTCAGSQLAPDALLLTPTSRHLPTITVPQRLPTPAVISCSQTACPLHCQFTPECTIRISS